MSLVRIKMAIRIALPRPGTPTAVKTPPADHPHRRTCHGPGQPCSPHATRQYRGITLASESRYHRIISGSTHREVRYLNSALAEFLPQMPQRPSLRSRVLRVTPGNLLTGCA